MNNGPTLAVGSTGADTRRLQVLLVMIKDLDFTEIDGSFGPLTQAAVKSFQSGNGLTGDGVVGPATWQKLPADPQTGLLARGSTGSTVTALQNALLRYGGPGSTTDPGGIDGNFGPKTEAAVKTYQGQRGVTADGIVGDRTWWVPAGAAGATLASLAGLVTA
jgi:peptidoglycan hydrolase-like protein with peptidoglycan-binding domain